MEPLPTAREGPGKGFPLVQLGHWVEAPAGGTCLPGSSDGRAGLRLRRPGCHSSRPQGASGVREGKQFPQAASGEGPPWQPPPPRPQCLSSPDVTLPVHS